MVGLGFQCNEFENAKTHPLIEYQKCLTDKGLISYIAKYNKLKSGLDAEIAYSTGFVKELSYVGYLLTCYNDNIIGSFSKYFGRYIENFLFIIWEVQKKIPDQNIIIS